MAKPKLTDVISAYVAMREKLRELDKAHKESTAALKLNMDKVELYIQKQFADTGIDSVKAGKHTAFKAMKDSIAIDSREDFKKFLYGEMLMALRKNFYKTMDGDWQPDGELNFNDHVDSLMDSDVLDILTLAANKNSCKAYMEEHKGILPEGVQYRQEVSIQIRKGK